jgi:predicted Zn finger-like uncharacterized protein
VLTQCPNCQTIFRVTSEILRVAEGQVRCGRCQTQFDALARLIDEDDNGDLQVVHTNTARDEAQTETIQVEEPPTHEDITLEGRRIEISGTYRSLDAQTNEPAIREEVIEEWVDLDEEDTPPLASEPQPEPEQASRAAQPFEPTRLRRMSTSRVERPASESNPELEFLAPPVTRALPISRAWQWLAAPLLLILLAQIVHAHRGTLARNPKLGPAVISLYHVFGSNLTPEWNLHAYEIRQWGVVSDPNIPGTLKVRASVKNLAEFPQPYPLLKLVLEDRWGEQVRARAFEPREYLDSSATAERMMAPAQEANATIAIVDPGPDAEGFRFDVCLRGNGGAVCAGDVPQS